MPETEEVTTVSQSAPAKVVKTTRKVVPPPIKTEPPQERYETKKVIFRFYQFVWYVLGVIEVLLAFRIILQALGANPTSGFTRLMYTLSDPFALPFSGMFTPIVQGNSVFELSMFVAMIFYLVLAYGLVALMQLLKPTSPEEVDENV